jgi:hypothetical protein
MGAAERKQYSRIHKWRMQAHRIRRKRKAKRRRLAAIGKSHGYDRMRRFAAYGIDCQRLQPVQETSKREKMNKNRIIEIVAKIIVAALTAFLTAITTTSCLGKGPFFG